MGAIHIAPPLAKTSGARRPANHLPSGLTAAALFRGALGLVGSVNRCGSPEPSLRIQYIPGAVGLELLKMMPLLS